MVAGVHLGPRVASSLLMHGISLLILMLVLLKILLLVLLNILLLVLLNILLLVLLLPILLLVLLLMPLWGILLILLLVLIELLVLALALALPLLLHRGRKHARAVQGLSVNLDAKSLELLLLLGGQGNNRSVHAAGEIPSRGVDHGKRGLGRVYLSILQRLGV